MDAANDMINALTDEQRMAVMKPFDAKERRMWQNTHLYFFRFGIRLDEANEYVRSLILRLLETTMSPRGYSKLIQATETNAFLGRLYNGQGVLNRYSYGFTLFGKPSASEPWSWSFFGHHVCLNFFIYGTHIEISPTFMGAEPNVVDDLPSTPVELYTGEQDLGLRLMRELPPRLQKVAHIRDSMDQPNDAPKHTSWSMCGAFQDNRVVPLQGVCFSEVSSELRLQLVKTVEQFLLYLPTPALRRKLDEVERFMDETWFCWVGGLGYQDPFYYRIQSPVIICEFEHCASIFLGNTTPGRFHIHTHVRTPNGGDYGFAVLE